MIRGPLVLAWLALSLPAAAQEADARRLTLDRLFSGEFAESGFGPARWLADGSGYTTLEPAEGGKGRDLVRHDPASGQAAALIPAARLVPEGRDKPLDVANYAWSRDGSALLVFTNTRRVWRQNTRGDYWVIRRDGGPPRKLGGDAPEASLMFAKLGPDGRRAAYVRDRDLYVEDLASGRVTRLTTAAAPAIINGTFDWVYEEEWSLRDGFRWSPDGRSIAFWQLDTAGVRDFFLVNNTDDVYAKVIPIPYPKAGETNPAARVGIVPATGGDVRWLDVPGDPRDQYIARMDWAESSDEVVLQRVNRAQDTVDVMLGDARTGAVHSILTERDAAWVDVGDDLHWIDGGRRFTWISERDGWRHLYAAPRAGGEPERLTSGDYDVLKVVHVDDKGRWVDVLASPGNATQAYLFRVPLDGTSVRRLTPADQPGTHAYAESPDGRWAFHTRSAFGQPPTIELVALPRHRPVRTLADNAGLRKELESLDRGEAGFFRLPIGGGVALDGWMMKPPGFDPSKRYPLLIHVYGEPAGQTALDAWGGFNYLWHLMLTQRGYVVLSVDNRGTPAPRGRAWRKSVHRQIGVLASKDQADALKAAERRWPFLDPGRVGIWGWSGGGSMTLNALFRYPELYQVGIAIASVPDQRLYDTIYQERYMGRPQDNPEGYREGSPLTHAARLRGDLLLVHGTGDDNCHYQGCEALVNALVAANRPFTLMAYPNRTHAIAEGSGTRRHLFELMTRFLLDHLPPGPRDP